MMIYTTLAMDTFNYCPASEAVRDTFIRFTDAQIAEIIPLHRELAGRFEKWLMQNEYFDVQKEKDRVDVRFRGDSRCFIAELKICYELNTRQAIHEALGQIFEYNHYPSRTLHDEWWLVLNQKPADVDTTYIKDIRDRYHIPIYLAYEANSETGEFVIDK